ncbi:MAG: ParB-like nuclease domain-containing protein [Xanthomonadaceae bacterium]|nr:ParB-like nuclease domain-containing protein [Xanthomonadaceae bacterium]
MLSLDLIRTDGGTQSRVELNEETYLDYAEAMLAGAKFPAVTVFHDGASYWLADGFHRFFAVQEAGLHEIEADIRQGTQRDAVLFSLGANGSHGQRRTNADKRKAVETLFADAEWSAWSNTEIARACSVSEGMVRSLRKNEVTSAPAERTYTTKHGTEAVMQTANIGKSAKFKGKPKKGPKADAIRAALAEAAEQHRSPQAEAAPEYSELDRAHDQIADLQAALAIATMGDVSEEDKQQATALIAELRADLKTASAELSAVKSTRDFLMEENTQMKRQMALQRRELEKLRSGAGA